MTFLIEIAAEIVYNIKIDSYATKIIKRHEKPCKNTYKQIFFMSVR